MLDIVGASFKGHTDTIIGLALSSDCAVLASASDDHTIKLWAFESDRLLASFHVPFAHHLIFSPDLRQLAYTTHYNTIIYLCNILPDILHINAPRGLPLSDLLNSDATVHPAATPGEAPCWTEFRAVRHAGISRIRPTDMREKHYEAGRQPLPQDLLHFHGGPAPDLPGTEILSVIAPPPRRPTPVKKGAHGAYLEREDVNLTLVKRFQILRDIIAGLQYLHANSVIHGNFSGPNVLIYGDGSACIADFGLF
ncbi:hypothetical protein EV702DRAFT_1191354 [Suillus placidus]|uniref:Protein kinase domain-containing protein n=1 Tax=Suillus placidus TaxID=48579 RepID=A0A9P7D8G4_9AGAM|nr:hypothetical protein EV702DRAFT_1191354 [Suillus placidus]